MIVPITIGHIRHLSRQVSPQVHFRGGLELGRLLTAASMYLLLLVVSGCGAVVVDAAHDPPGENAGSVSPSSPGSPGSQPGPPAAAIAISGQPATTVTVGSTYTFTPSATESGPGVV